MSRVRLRTSRGASRPRPRRPQRRAVDTRARLVEAALQVFAAKGFEAASTREIARRAGVALAALPYHFTTKEALWRAAADRSFGALGETFRNLLGDLEGVEPRARLRLLLRDFVRFQAAHPELHRFMLHEATVKGPRLEWLVETHIRPIYDFVGTALEVARRAGIETPARPAHLHYMLLGAASSPYALGAEFELLTGEDPNAPALVDEHVAALERIFFAPSAGAARRSR